MSIGFKLHFPSPIKIDHLWVNGFEENTEECSSNPEAIDGTNRARQEETYRLQPAQIPGHDRLA